MPQFMGQDVSENFAGAHPATAALLLHAVAENVDIGPLAVLAQNGHPQGVTGTLGGARQDADHQVVGVVGDGAAALLEVARRRGAIGPQDFDPGPDKDARCPALSLFEGLPAGARVVEHVNVDDRTLGLA